MVANVGGTAHKLVDHTLERRLSVKGTTSRAVEDTTKHVGQRLWGSLKKHPLAGVGVLGALGVAAASVIGVGEIAIGAAVAYAAFNVLVGGESPREAARELAHELERF